jgi:DNA mismatch repair ATPase MutL
MSRKPLGRRLSSVGLLIVATLSSVLCLSQSSKAQQASKEQQPSKEKQASKEQQPSKEQPSSKPPQTKEATAEQVAESAIAVAGNGFGRAVLAQIRRNGLEVGKETRTRPDGRSEESRYELRFVHGEKPEQDKIRIDSKTPQAEYTLVYGEGRLFGIINGATFTPRPDDAADFLSRQAHSIDALLRYKEFESKISSAGKDKQQGIDLYVIDLLDKANRKTRYFISARTFRILSLEYEEAPPGSSTTVKYTRRFYDYRLAQGTQVPYRTVTMEDGKLTTETHILTITYGVKMDDALFKNPSATSASGNP